MTILLTLWGILKESLFLFNEAGVYLLFGFLVAGLLYVTIPEEKIFQHLGGSSFSAVLKASLMGVPLPLCSCGVVPTALYLKRRGAADGPILSFLVTTPETGLDSIAVTYALLGPVMTIFRPVAAMVTGVATGLAANLFGPRPTAQGDPPPDECAVCDTHGEEIHHHTLLEKANRVVDYAFNQFLGSIAKWFLLGILLGGALSYFLPPGILERWLGGGITSMLVMLAVGIPLYVCASASTPIAAALMLKGLNPGAALVFLLAGPATNAASLAVLTRFLGRRLITIYLLTIGAVALGMGMLLNLLIATFGLGTVPTIASSNDLIPFSVKVSASTLLAVLILYQLVKGRGLREADAIHQHHG